MALKGRDNRVESGVLPARGGRDSPRLRGRRGIVSAPRPGAPPRVSPCPHTFVIEVGMWGLLAGGPVVGSKPNAQPANRRQTALLRASSRSGSGGLSRRSCRRCARRESYAYVEYRESMPREHDRLPARERLTATQNHTKIPDRWPGSVATREPRFPSRQVWIRGVRARPKSTMVAANDRSRSSTLSTTAWRPSGVKRRARSEFGLRVISLHLLES